MEALITNTSAEPIIFKVKANNAERYAVRSSPYVSVGELKIFYFVSPAQGIIPAGETFKSRFVLIKMTAYPVLKLVIFLNSSFHSCFGCDGRG